MIRRLAARCPLAIASGAIRPEIERVLQREGLLVDFQTIVAAGDTPVSKPAPDPYARAVELLSAATGVALAPGECVAIEDSRWGLESARAAGLRTMAVAHTYPAAVLECRRGRDRAGRPHLGICEQRGTPQGRVASSGDEPQVSSGF